MQEECKYGEKCLRLDCKYVHNIRKRSVPCVHFQNKGCFKGDRCPYMHIPKTLTRPAESQLNIDLAPVIPAEISLPSKRLSPDPIEPNKEFPEDISAILDQFEEAPPSMQAPLLPLPSEKVQSPSLHPSESIETTEAKGPPVEVKPSEVPEKVIQVSEEFVEIETLLAKKSPLEKTPELKPFETPEPIEKNLLNKALETETAEPAQTEGKINEIGTSEEKNRPGIKQNELKLGESKSAEVKMNEGKITKGLENSQKAKVPEGPPKIHQSGKNMIERTIKANRTEETVSLRPPERKKTAIEGATRILTLEEIKEKKRLEAQLKEQEAQSKEPENPSKVTQNLKISGKPEEKPEEKPVKDVKVAEERPVKTIPVTSPPFKTTETVTLPVKTTETLTLPVKTTETLTLPFKTTETLTLPVKTTETVTLPVKTTETVTLPVKSKETLTLPVKSKETVTLPSKTIENISLPVKRPISNQSPAPLKQAKTINHFPSLVTEKEWEPYKQVLKSLDFSEFNLSPDDVQDCRKLAEVLSSPEGVSKVIFDLEQKLSNYPEIPADPDFDSLSLTEKIEKLYQDLFKIPIT